MRPHSQTTLRFIGVRALGFRVIAVLLLAFLAVGWSSAGVWWCPTAASADDSCCEESCSTPPRAELPCCEQGFLDACCRLISAAPSTQVTAALLLPPAGFASDDIASLGDGFKFGEPSSAARTPRAHDPPSCLHETTRTLAAPRAPPPSSFA